MKKISIIVPVFNGAETIHQCLDAILKLTYPEDLIEIIVINDGSTDNTLQIIHEIHSPRIKIISNQENKGRAYSRLKGAKEASNEFLLFIDTRVIVERNALSEIAKYDEPIQSPLIIKGNNNIWDIALRALRTLVFKGNKK